MTEASGGPADLPFAKGRVFHSLDEYLAYRRQLGQTDRPWYEEISPGHYRLVARHLPGQPPQEFTRAELLAKFGFDH